MSGVLVVGGAGRTGGRIVTRLRERGDDVVFASRRPGPGGVRLDLSTATPDDDAFDNVDAVVVSVEPPTDADGAEALLHHGVATVAAAAARRGRRLILVSQIYVTRPSAMPGMEAVTTARWRGEQAVRAAGGDYAVVRPAWLHDQPPTGSRVEQGDKGEGRTSRDSVADVCVHLLTTPQAGRVTFELYDAPSGDWTAGLAQLRPDDGGARG